MVATALLSSGKVFQHEGQEFYLNTEQKMTWKDSRGWCQGRGGDLAQPQGGWDIFREQVLQLLPPGEYHQICCNITQHLSSVYIFFEINITEGILHTIYFI